MRAIFDAGTGIRDLGKELLRLDSHQFCSTFAPMEKNRLPTFSWVSYDWANSAFATTIMAGFFPLFFKSYWADPSNPTHSTFYLGVANSTASIVIAALAPFLGAIADKGGARKKLMATFAFLGIIMTGGLRLLEQGAWEYAVLFYITATIGWSGANKPK